jgi:hypothetical protein
MDKNLSISNTSHRVAMVRLIADMVNEKKHDKVLEYRSDAGEKIFIEGERGSYLFSKGFTNDHPNLKVMLPADAIPREVAAYRFACNGLEVGRSACHRSNLSNGARRRGAAADEV